MNDIEDALAFVGLLAVALFLIGFAAGAGFLVAVWF